MVMKQFEAKIRIKLRDGILDVQGKTVEQALGSIGYKEISSVRIGKFVELMVEAEDADNAKEKVDKACKELIANPIIEDYFIDINELSN